MKDYQLELIELVDMISTIAESEDSQESVDSATDTQKRREILSRRPSYRYECNIVMPAFSRSTHEKFASCSILLEYSSRKIWSMYHDWAASVNRYLLYYFEHTVFAITQGGAIQLANNGTDGVQGLQTLTMTNAAATQPGTTILQYAQTTDGQQILVPSNQVVVQGTGVADIHHQYGNAVHAVVPSLNIFSYFAYREAARECRRKKKEYVKCLENRVAVLENQNKTLIEELKALKDLYCHKSD
ncbi:PREDICTED: cyclic AMP-responsive element-binding protein 1-like [Thamnophis sirtalis]|uniref:Cyclic AMP-responsive element-binding protein 1-like n=1 Tax=Thamnophis sirtalis TaxID=35019 RepID=A0A6I9YFH3_9SAUR|nr:PREDICTED: cyclic AMP-responsive element-binding protein 1-like [Thamnophis sirtalis]